jgi:hypothetical protein
MRLHGSRSGTVAHNRKHNPPNRYNPAANIQLISPTPLLMVVAENDHVTPTDLALTAYERALEAKKLVITTEPLEFGIPDHLHKSTPLIRHSLVRERLTPRCRIKSFKLDTRQGSGRSYARICWR